MKKTLCSFLVLTILSVAVPAWAEEKTPSRVDRDATPLRSAIQQAGPQVVLTQGRSSALSQTPHSLPRTPSDRIRKQGGGGGGKTGMVIGLVSSLVGIAATVYVVKQIKKTTEEQKQ